jgi:hypothetical protein
MGVVRQRPIVTVTPLPYKAEIAQQLFIKFIIEREKIDDVVQLHNLLHYKRCTLHTMRRSAYMSGSIYQTTFTVQQKKTYLEKRLLKDG